MKKIFLFITICSVGLFNVNAQTNLPGYGSGSSLNTTIGCGNLYYSHILTDASKFYFNKPITVNSGQIGAFTGNDLQLMTGTSYNTPGVVRMSISKSTGNVGIGSTYSSSDKLKVNGHLSVTNGNISTTGGLYSNNRLSIYNGSKLATIKPGGDSWLFDFDHKLVFRNNSQSWIHPLLLQGNGTVVVAAADDLGSTYYDTQGFKLVVNGGILAEEIKVILDVPQSDFVFEEDYELTPLEEVEAFVTKNKHLSDVPSAEEFKENGYKVGEMDDLLLRKVEELTLYVIQLQKEVQSLKKSN